LNTFKLWVIVMDVLINLLIAAGLLAVVPAGLRLLADPALAAAQRCWPAGAAAGAVSLWLPRGATATALATLYAIAAALLCGYAVSRPVPARRDRPAEAAVLTALVSPAVAASALIADRAGYQLFGFDPDVLARTVAHFHLAGFAAALTAGLLTRAGPGRAADLAALTVPAGTLLVLLGSVTADAVELAGALVLTAGGWTAVRLLRRQSLGWRTHSASRRAAWCAGTAPGRIRDRGGSHDRTHLRRGRRDPARAAPGRLPAPALPHGAGPR
jgi:hypothetical protein